MKLFTTQKMSTILQYFDTEVNCAGNHEKSTDKNNKLTMYTRRFTNYEYYETRELTDIKLLAIYSLRYQIRQN